MERRKYPVLMVALVVLLVSGCHADKNFTQTFTSEKDPSQTLTLTSKTGFIHPNAGFPHNIFFKVFGGGELSGTYQQRTDEQTVAKGTFIASKDGEKQWIKFKPGDGSADKTEWKVQVKLGGMLADGDKIWMMSSTSADAKAVSGITFGGN